MSKFFSKILVVAFVISLLSVGTANAIFGGKSSKITITGSTTVLPIAQSCAEEYMNKNSKAKISVSGGGSSVGIAALIDGRCDIADASRKIKDKEVDKAKENGINPVEHVVAKDALAIVVNPNVSGIEDIKLEDIQKIYLGEIKKWSDLGAKGGDIVIVSRDTASGTYETFHELVMKKKKIVPEALMLASNNAVATTVAETPNAIGYIGLGYLQAAKVKPLKVNGVEASTKTVLNGEYKISRNLHMYTNGAPKGEVKKFINFVLSKDGQKLVGKAGFVPLK